MAVFLFSLLLLTEKFGKKLIGAHPHTWHYIPEQPTAILHIIHGMMEHSARYREFAVWLSGQGIAVYSADLPGHGAAAASPEDLGHIDGDAGWDLILKSVRSVQDQIRAAHPGLPVFLLGHSFGSVVARDFAQQHVADYPIAGLVLSGAMQQPSPLLCAGMGLIALQKFFRGNRHRSALMVRLGYGQYSRHFKPARTDFDWLSTDPAVVDAYLADPWCGYACTLGFYQGMFRALRRSWSCRNIQSLPRELPVLLLSGELDPAIRFGADTRNLHLKYQRCGLDKTEMRLFEGGRHEMLNERNKTEVWAHILRWIRNNSNRS